MNRPSTVGIRASGVGTLASNAMTDAPDIDLDDELATHVQRAFDMDETPETYRDLWAAIERTFGAVLDRDLSLADLCTTERSPHWAAVGDRRQHYQCVTDAYMVGAVIAEPVTARTVCPVSGTELAVEFDGEGGVTAPAGAVLAFGVRRDVEPPDGPVTPEAMYGRVCPYNKAFASRAAFEEWADEDALVAEAVDLEAALALLTDVFGDHESLGAGPSDVEAIGTEGEAGDATRGSTDGGSEPHLNSDGNPDCSC